MLSIGWLTKLIASMATVSMVFAVLVVASSRDPRRLPRLIGSQERCVTILLVAGSALLITMLQLAKGFLQWAFANHLALQTPPQPVAAYIAGTTTFNGAVETSLLFITWFLALMLLERLPGAAARPSRQARRR